MLAEITPLILTFNEAPNIERTLSMLKWAKEIIVVDSFSTDETCDLVRKLPKARIVQRDFDSFAQQCNFGLQHIRTEWVLSLDADYVLSEELVQETTDLQPSEEVGGYRAAFMYCVCGRPLRASLYPPRVVLYRRERAHYRDEGHGHRVQVEGRILPLRSVIYHDDRKPLDRWLREQDRYARLEAELLLKARDGSWKIEDGAGGSGAEEDHFRAVPGFLLHAARQRADLRRMARMVLRVSAHLRGAVAFVAIAGSEDGQKSVVSGPGSVVSNQWSVVPWSRGAVVL